MTRNSASKKSFFYRLLYRFAYWVTRVIATVLFRAKIEGREHTPQKGGALICSNHQSYLDPFFVGMAFDRSVCFVARRTLFDNSILSKMMQWFDTISLDRDGLGLSGLKAILRRTKAGELILMFPEGTRTMDGSVGTIQPGFSLIARRTKVPIVPVAVDGAYEALPRNRKMIRLAKVAVCVGDPIDNQLAESLSEAELVAELTRRIKDCHARAREMRGR